MDDVLASSVLFALSDNALSFITGQSFRIRCPSLRSGIECLFREYTTKAVQDATVVLHFPRERLYGMRYLRICAGELPHVVRRVTVWWLRFGAETFRQVARRYHPYGIAVQTTARTCSYLRKRGAPIIHENS